MGLGELGGIGAGLQSFTDSYLRTKQLNQQEQAENTRLGLLKAEQDRAAQHQQFEEGIQGPAARVGLAEKEAGLISNPGINYDQDTGSVTKSGLLQSQQNTALGQAQLNQQKQDPNSQLSVMSRNYHRAAFAGVYGDKKAQEMIPDNMSAAQIESAGGEDAVKLQTSKFAEQGQFAKAQSIAGAMQGRVDVQRDNQTATAVDKVTNDKLLQQYTQRIQGAQRINSQLAEVKAGHIVDTNQFLNDLNTEYVNLLTGSNNSALGKQERTEYTTYAGQLANLIQKIKAEPQSIHSPDIMNQLETSVNSLEGVYRGQVNTRASQLQRNYTHNPDATKAQKDKIQEMIGDFGTPQSEQQQPPAPGPTPHAQDSQAVQWAKLNPKDPRAQKILQLNGVQ
jgi:hypothetical protein